MTRTWKQVRWLVAAAALLVTATGCGGRWRSEIPPEGTFLADQTLKVDGASRAYHAYIPSDASAGLPLVLSLHGHGQDIDTVTGRFGDTAPPSVWMHIAEREGFIVAYPQGLVGPDNQSGWNDCRSDTTKHTDADDVAFLRALVDRLDQTYDIDDQRVYVTGVSNGGFMSLRMAVEADDLVAAAAPVIAALPAQPDCAEPTRPVSVLFMNGTEDPLVPYGGGAIAGNDSRGTVQSTEDSVDFWRAHDQTDSAGVTEMRPDLDSSDDSQVVTVRYSGGTDGHEVMLYRVEGGGHTEPSISQRYGLAVQALLGKQNNDIEMAEEIWSFFADKSR